MASVEAAEVQNRAAAAFSSEVQEVVAEAGAAEVEETTEVSPEEEATREAVAPAGTGNKGNAGSAGNAYTWRGERMGLMGRMRLM